jgi:drug/metabolite transporter (DMT)-like permease
MSTEPTSQLPPPRALVVAAFLTIYLVGGSTYLAIRVAVETIPPFLMAGARFLIAGLLLFGWLRLRGTPAPTSAHWRTGVIAGILLLLGGNGLVVWAEQTVSSGLASLLIALAPVWFALLEWLRPGGSRPTRRTLLGILVGLGGVLLLVTSRNSTHTHGALHFSGVLALICAGLLWAAGSLYTRHGAKVPSPWMNSAVQMICGGIALLIVSGLLGEALRFNSARLSPRSLAAFVYLIVLGSWVGFSAYVWLLKVSTPARVATYAYVNPVIAVFLGWMLLDEVVNARMVGAALVIIAGVIITTLPARIPKLTRARRADASRKPERCT